MSLIYLLRISDTTWRDKALEILAHYNGVIVGAMASHITNIAVVYSTVYSDVDQRKHHSSTSLALVRGIHRWPVNSTRKWPVTRNMFRVNDVIMSAIFCCVMTLSHYLILRWTVIAHQYLRDHISMDFYVNILYKPYAQIYAKSLCKRQMLYLGVNELKHERPLFE